MFPPKKLFTKEGWYSYDLYSDQQDKQIEAMKQAKNLRKEGIVILEPSTNESIYVEEVQA